MGRLVKKVTLSLFRVTAYKARCAGNGRVLTKHCNAVDCAPEKTRRASLTIARAALVTHHHSAAMLVHDRLAPAAVRPAERYLFYQAAH